MNVQQINDSGREIWEFVVTALVLTALAISGWGLSNAIQKKSIQKKWTSIQEKWDSIDHEGRPLSWRLSLLGWLVLHCKFWRHISFGLLLGLMTDGWYGLKDASRIVIDHQYSLMD